MAEPALKVAHLMRTASRSNAGIFVANVGLIGALAARNDVLPEVFAAGDGFAAQDLPEWGATPVHALRALPPQAFSYTPGLAGALRAFAPAIVHQHGLWLYQSLAARRHGKPVLISLHGMMTPWAMQHSQLRKKVALALHERGNVARAACLHALTPGEARDIRALGFANPIGIIPNGIDCRQGVAADAAASASKPVRELLFLGRLHPVKGIDSLLRGWAAFQRGGSAAKTGWRLNIAGWGEENYRHELQRLVSELEITSSVAFSGPKHGADLWATYAGADAFILTSRSEAMPMTILEAWASVLPVIMTAECGLPDGLARGAARLTSREPEAIGAAIAAIAEMPDTARRAMGLAGRALVEQNYSWNRAANSFAQVYHWLASGGARPDCVID